MRHHAFGLLLAVVVLFLSWCSGYDFDTRGAPAVVTAGLAIFLYGWGLGFSFTFHRKQADERG